MELRGWEDPLEKEMVTQLQYACLENPMDGRAWWAIVHRVAKSRTRLSDFKQNKTNKADSGKWVV